MDAYFNCSLVSSNNLAAILNKKERKETPKIKLKD